MKSKKDLLSILDIKDEIPEIVDLAIKFKNGKINGKPLEGKSLAMIFQKSSTRTRVSFEVGMYELGGNSLFLSASDLQLFRGEPISDTAKVLSRYVDGIMIRTFEHQDVVELSNGADVPVINGLTNLEHPCQALADVQTILEKKKDWSVKLAYLGDGNNVCNSLLLISAYLGMDISIATPKRYGPNKDIVNEAENVSKETGSNVQITSHVEDAVSDADVVYTDAWVSMGDEKEKRRDDFLKYQVNNGIMKLAAKDAIFMHCLPAVRGEEVVSDVIDGSRSVIIDQAENRLHAQKAILYYLMK